jgi:hypothetical protein
LKGALGPSWKRLPYATTHRRILATGMELQQLEQQAAEFPVSLKQQLSVCVRSIGIPGESRTAYTISTM